jgi:hypothetical protein
MLSVYAMHGYDPLHFRSFLEKFRGDNRPVDDIADYIGESFGIQMADIAEDARRQNIELQRAVLEAWQEIHIKRRADHPEGQDIALRMARHDADNYLGVIQRRHTMGSGHLGYTSWWLTLDRRAFTLIEALPLHLLGRGQSPVMSADFLANYLAVGPLRGKVANAEDIPLSLDAAVIESMSPELFEEARRIRQQHAGSPEHVIRRKVRDGLDDAKRRTGELHDRGLAIELSEEG